MGTKRHQTAAGAVVVALFAGILLAIGTSGPTCQVTDGKADRLCSPGVANPAVTQANLAQTICKPGWATSVRPPKSYTEGLKRKQMAQNGELGPLGAYREDHVISLSAGGAPRDPRNLFPQPAAASYEKDDREREIHASICSGAIPLVVGQQELATSWTHPH
jgi:hypothetical protein